MLLFYNQIYSYLAMTTLFLPEDLASPHTFCPYGANGGESLSFSAWAVWVRSVADGKNIDARLQMLVASTMGATAFQKGLGAMHALAHPLGALFDAHHGLLNAILMPYVLSANRSAIEARINRVSAYIGLAEPNFAGFISWILDLRSRLAIPHSLAEIEIDRQLADRVAQMASEDPSAGGNPIAFSTGQYRQIFQRAVAGDL